MDRRRPVASAVLFFLVYIIQLTIVAEVALGLQQPSRLPDRLKRLDRNSYLLMLDPRRQQARRFSFLPDHRVHYSARRPHFGTLNLRSTDPVSPEPDRYWDFVLGSGTFEKRGNDYRPSKEEEDIIPGRDRIRRGVTSAGNTWPIFDVLGRRIKGKGRPNDAKAYTAACRDNCSNDDSNEVKKKTDGKDARSFDDNQEFFDFLMGEEGL